MQGTGKEHRRLNHSPVCSESIKTAPPKGSFMAINRLMYKSHPQVNCSASVWYNLLVSPTFQDFPQFQFWQNHLCAENLGDCSHRQQVDFLSWNAEACRMLAWAPFRPRFPQGECYRAAGESHRAPRLTPGLTLKAASRAEYQTSPSSLSWVPATHPSPHPSSPLGPTVLSISQSFLHTMYA